MHLNNHTGNEKNALAPQFFKKHRVSQNTVPSWGGGWAPHWFTELSARGTLPQL